MLNNLPYLPDSGTQEIPSHSSGKYLNSGFTSKQPLGQKGLSWFIYLLIVFFYWAQLFREKRRKHSNPKEGAAQTSQENPDLETFFYHQTGGIQMKNTEISAQKFFCLSLMSVLQRCTKMFELEIGQIKIKK